MATYMSSSPLEPFHVAPRVLRAPGGTGSTVPPAPPDASTTHSQPPSGAKRNLIDVAVALGFGVLYVACDREVLFVAPAVLALLLVVMLRLQDWAQKVALPVLSISTILLALGIVRMGTQLRLGHPLPGSLTFSDHTSPVILAAILYFTRVRSYVGTMVLVVAVALLASGLLPAVGWLVVMTGIRYILYCAVVLGLLVDFIIAANREPVTSK